MRKSARRRRRRRRTTTFRQQPQPLLRLGKLGSFVLGGAGLGFFTCDAECAATMLSDYDWSENGVIANALAVGHPGESLTFRAEVDLTVFLTASPPHPITFYFQ